MKLERLDIQGFGRLRDLRVDFAPQMTVLLGENESGKSSIQRALRAALYGLDAGGPGRAITASDWARWRPWAGGRYGLVLTYALEDGRRFRVARRLDEREPAAQVHELGGRDLTDDFRAGRQIAPALFQLGIDEAVFCATACLGEESLRPDAPDSAAARAERIQEAIERLADSASRSTAAEALGRLRQAAERVGSERAGKSLLGRATQRLRDVDVELDRARERSAMLADEQQRLRRLEADAEAAERQRLDAERAWLGGRLAALAATRRGLAEALAEAGQLEQTVARWRHCAGFPAGREERVTSLGGELRQAAEAEAEAAARWESAREHLRLVTRRRVELATTIRALGEAPRVEAADFDAAEALAAEVTGEAGIARRVEAVRVAGGRLDALRREIAATGLGSVPPGSADAVAALVEEAAGAPSRRHLQPVAATLAGLAAVLGSAGLAAGQPLLAAIVAAVCLGAGLVVLLAHRLGGGPAAAAQRRLGRMCPGLDLGEAGMRRTAERLPALRLLHADLARQELIVETGRAELDAAAARIAVLLQRCLVLAARVPVEVPDGAVASALMDAPARLARAAAALDALRRAAGAARQRHELQAEDQRLAAEEIGLARLRDDAERRAQARGALAAELARHLAEAGLPPEEDTSRAVASFRQAAATRRQLEAVQARLLEVRRLVAALGPAGDDALAAQEAQLAGELRRRGGDPHSAGEGQALESAQLQVLELEADRARQAAGSASAQAGGLRERLAGMLDSLPCVADLEDQRAACAAVRDRALHQLAALKRAGELIEEAARAVHRDVAPRLAASVAARLSLLTEGRYSDANVDAERLTVALQSAERPELVPLELLSHGTRDQVALLLRVALSEVFGGAGEPAPLLLDDPLLSADPLRRAAGLDFLLQLAETTQVVLTTSEPGVAEHIARHGQNCAVVSLGSVASSRPMRPRDATVAAGGARPQAAARR